MVNYCIVPGCKTNRRNEVKLPVFQFPKDPILKEEWRKVMGIESLNDKQHRVCQKHFAKEDVITCTNFFDSSGNIIATLPSKIPRLKKNAKPCFIKISAEEEAAIVSRNAKNFNTHLSNNNNNETANEDNTLDGQEANTSAHDETNNKSEPEETNDNSYDEEENSTEERNAMSPEEIKPTPYSEKDIQTRPGSNVINNFISLCRSFKEVILPENCYLNFSTEQGYIALFEIGIVQSNERCDTFVKRSLNINNNLEIHYSVSNKPILPESFNLKSKVETVNELEICFQQFFTMYVCEGIADFKDVDLVKDKISYTDSLGVLRHHRCKLLSPNEKCNMCARVRKTISQKKLRMSRRNTVGRETGGLDLISSNLVNRDSLHVWKKTVRAQRKAIYRAKLKIKKMKIEMDKIKTDIKNVNLNDLLENCVKNKIPDVQKVLIQEIVSLAKSKNQNGHRYNESWVMLCLLLHIRSPKEYRHMRNINLLPLPCERTIRKYLSMTRCHKDL